MSSYRYDRNIFIISVVTLKHPSPTHSSTNQSVSVCVTPNTTGSYAGFKINVEAELEYYKGIREEILAMTIDTIEYSNQALKDGKSILIEGANATSTYSLLFPVI